MDNNLESKLMKNLRDLSDTETDAIRILIAMFINKSKVIKNQKIESYKNGIEGQIEYYGRNHEEYQKRINVLIEKYSKLIDTIVDKYNTRFVTVLDELQTSQNNQKLAITNAKICIDSNNRENLKASVQKKKNYEIVIGECTRQLTKCETEMVSKINEIFYSKDKGLIVGQASFMQKIINIFKGNSKIETYVMDSAKEELVHLGNIVNMETAKISNETVMNVAIIKDAQIQVQNVFKKMIEV